MTEVTDRLHPTLQGTDWLPAAERRAGLVSVIIPSYNHSRFIRQAICSVAMQTHRDIELIVVDDRSIDDSVGVILNAIEEFGIANSIVETQANAGTSAAINRGLMLSSGEYICVLNSDDYYHPSRVAELIQAMEGTQSELAFSQVTFVDDHGKGFRNRNSDVAQAWVDAMDSCPTTGFALLQFNGILTSSNMLMTARLVERVGLFTPLRYVNDWEYALRALAETEPLFVRKDLLFYRIHDTGTVHSMGYTWAQAIVEHDQVLSTYFALVEQNALSNKLAPGPDAWPSQFEEFLADNTFEQWWSGFASPWTIWERRASRPREDLEPPPELVTLVGSPTYADFKRVGHELRASMSIAGLRADHDVLDIGCGSGRLAISMTDFLTDDGSYTGFDVVEEAITWCRDTISSRFPNFRFDLADVQNGFYRPAGSVSPVEHRFPYDDDSFDFVVLTSVFTHMPPQDVEAYAAEIARVLRPDGLCYATFFFGNEQSYAAIENGSAAINFSVKNAIHRSIAEGPAEGAICLDEANILAMLKQQGLRLARPIEYGDWTQSLVPFRNQDRALFEVHPVEPPPTSGLQVVAVTHRPAIFERYVGSNKNLRRHPVVRYDNTVENVPVPVRYNEFIDTAMEDGWVAFIHHDFEFDVDPLPVLKKLPQDAIYGVVGARLTRKGKYTFIGAPGRKGVPRWERGEIMRVDAGGFVKCSTQLVRSGEFGVRPKRPLTVSTLDCCCLIVHSSLIRKHGLRFDERLAWHMYAEDFSLGARSAHGIETYVVPIESGHYGLSGTDSDDFRECLDLVIDKHGPVFASTCYAPPAIKRYHRLLQWHHRGRGVLIPF